MAIRAEGVALSLLTEVVQVEQLARDRIDRFLGLGFGTGPFLRAELAQRRVLFSHTPVLGDSVELVGRHVEAIGPGVLEIQVLALGLAAAHLDDTLITTDSMLDVHDIVAGGEIERQILIRFAVETGGSSRPYPADHFGVREHHNVRLGRQPPFGELAGNGEDRTPVRQHIECCLLHHRHVCLAQKLGEPLLLQGHDHDALFLAPELVAILYETLQAAAISR